MGFIQAGPRTVTRVTSSPPKGFVWIAMAKVRDMLLIIIICCETVWPSGKALGCRRKGLGSIPLRLSLLFRKVVVCGHCLVALFITSYWNIKMALNAARLNVGGVILVVTGIAKGIWSPSSPTSIPPPTPFSPSLISRAVSVDVDDDELMLNVLRCHLTY